MRTYKESGAATHSALLDGELFLQRTDPPNCSEIQTLFAPTSKPAIFWPRLGTKRETHYTSLVGICQLNWSITLDARLGNTFPHPFFCISATRH